MRRAARLTVSRAVALSSGPRPTQLETASASGSGSTRRSAIDLLSLHPPSRALLRPFALSSRSKRLSLRVLEPQPLCSLLHHLFPLPRQQRPWWKTGRPTRSRPTLIYPRTRRPARRDVKGKAASSVALIAQQHPTADRTFDAIAHQSGYLGRDKSWRRRASGR